MRIGTILIIAITFSLAGCSKYNKGGMFKSYSVKFIDQDNDKLFNFYIAYKLESGESIQGDLVSCQVVDSNEAIIDTSPIEGQLNNRGELTVEYKYNKIDSGKKIKIEIKNSNRSIKDTYDLILK